MFGKMTFVLTTSPSVVIETLFHKAVISGCLPQTRHARDWRKKGSSVYISEKVLGFLGSHCRTARLADT